VACGITVYIPHVSAHKGEKKKGRGKSPPLNSSRYQGKKGKKGERREHQPHQRVFQFRGEVNSSILSCCRTGVGKKEVRKFLARHLEKGKEKRREGRNPC